MTCTITIDGVFGLGAGPAVVRVVGTVTGCSADIEGTIVIASISCVSSDGPFRDRLAEVDASGRWQALLPLMPDDECHCNQRIFVRARCASDPRCSAELVVDRLQCVECPLITITGPDGDDVVLPVIVECRPDGTASLTVYFRVVNTTSQLIHVHPRPGHPEGVLISGGIVGFPPGASGVVAIVFGYPTPSFPEPFIEILDISFQPTGCPPIPIPVGPIERCPPALCPVITAIDVQLGECEVDPVDGVSKRRVRFTPTLAGPDPDAHDWSFGDGASQSATVPPGPVEHLYAMMPSSAPELCVTGPEGCDRTCMAVPLPQFEPCRPAGESGFCGALRWLVIIAGALAILAALLAICVPAAASALFFTAGVVAAAAVVAIILYVLLCPNKPCMVGLLITGQSTLGAGVAAIILSACCPWMVWAGLALAVAGLGTLLLWRSRCDQSRCALAKEITKVIGGVVLPVIGILGLILGLGGCLSGVALVWVSALFGPVAAYAASC